jgi:hypothetical protein
MNEKYERLTIRTKVDSIHNDLNALVRDFTNRKVLEPENNQDDFAVQIAHKLQHIQTLVQASMTVLLTNACTHGKQPNVFDLPGLGGLEGGN